MSGNYSSNIVCILTRLLFIYLLISVNAWGIDPVPKRKRGLWSQSALQNALDDVLVNHMSEHKAALKYKIPRRTLRNHISSGSRVKQLGRARVLSDTQEKDLLEQIKKTLKTGVPLTSKIIRREAYSFCEEHGIKHQFNGKQSTAGKKWLESFLMRNKHILNVVENKKTNEKHFCLDI